MHVMPPLVFFTRHKRLVRKYAICFWLPPTCKTWDVWGGCVLCVHISLCSAHQTVSAHTHCRNSSEFDVGPAAQFHIGVRFNVSELCWTGMEYNNTHSHSHAEIYTKHSWNTTLFLPSLFPPFSSPIALHTHMHSHTHSGMSDYLSPTDVFLLQHYANLQSHMCIVNVCVCVFVSQPRENTL